MGINLEHHFTLRTGGRTQGSRRGTFQTVCPCEENVNILCSKTWCLSVTTLSANLEFCNSDAIGHANFSWQCLRYTVVPCLYHHPLQTPTSAGTDLLTREGENRIFFFFFSDKPHHLCQHLVRHVWLTVRDLARWHFLISSKPLKAS